MKIISIINVIIGVWWGIANIMMFTVLRAGGTIHEPNEVIATIELVVAIVLTGWFLCQLPYWIKKLKEG